MQLKIGQRIPVRGAFATNEYEIVGVFENSDLILKADSRGRDCFSRGLVRFNLNGEVIEFSVMSTSWHESIDELVKHWTKVQKPSVQIFETVVAPPAPVGC